MKISIVIANDVKQIMMTPETKHEKEALKYIAPNEEYNVASMMGTYDSEPTHFSYNSEKCVGGYVRRFAEKDSLMFVLTPKSSTPQ